MLDQILFQVLALDQAFIIIFYIINVHEKELAHEELIEKQKLLVVEMEKLRGQNVKVKVTKI